jgi:hypothetical protein
VKTAFRFIVADVEFVQLGWQLIGFAARKCNFQKKSASGHAHKETPLKNVTKSLMRPFRISFLAG